MNLKSKSLYIYLIILLIISFAPFRGQTMSSLILSPFNSFEHFSFSNIFSLWVPAELGMYSMNLTPQLLYALILYKIFPSFLANTILYASIKILAGVSIYVFMGLVTKKPTPRIIGSIFYLLSIYGQAIILNSPAGGYLFYALFPLIIYFFFEFKKMYWPKYTFLILICFLILIDTNTTYIAYLFLTLIVYAIILDISQKRFKKSLHCIYFILLFFIATLGYYLPLFSTIVFYKSQLLASNLLAESAGWKSSYTSIVEIVRMMGSLDFYTKVSVHTFAKPFFQYFITNSVIVVISYFLVACSLIGLLFANLKEMNFSKIIYISLFTIFLFFSFGANISNPFIDIYYYFSNTFSFFAAFRDAYKSVSIINFLYAIGSTEFFLLIEKKRNYNLAVGGYLVAIFLLSYSYFIGQIFTKSEIVHVPEYWNRVASWNQQDEIHNRYKLLLPSINFPIYSFTNLRGKSTTFVDNIFDDRIIRPIGGSVYQNQMDELLSLYTYPQFTRILGFYGISYIVNQRDIDYQFYNSENPFTVSRVLQQKAKPIKTFGSNDQVEIYQVPQTFIKPPIYIPQHIVIATTSAITKTNLMTIFSEQPYNNFIFVDHSVSIPKALDTNITVDVKKISSNEYHLTFHNVSESFPFVFNQQFHEGWVVTGKNLLDRISVRHFMANGLVNGYIIDPNVIKQYDPSLISHKNGKMTLTLSLYFEPQGYMMIGYFFTFIALVASLSFFLYPHLIKKIKL